MDVAWYERKDVQDNLIVFGRAIQGIYPYEVIIQPDSDECRSGRCSFNDRTITVNPILFALPDKEQYLLTKALLVHEAGHRRHTTPSRLPAVTREIANILEDERIERRMYEEFIGVRWLIEKLACQFYKEAKPIDNTSDLPEKVVAYFLLLRWAKRINQPMKGDLSPNNLLLWEKVEPLVYESWQAESSETVNKNAIRIAQILGLDNNQHD